MSHEYMALAFYTGRYLSVAAATAGPFHTDGMLFISRERGMEAPRLASFTDDMRRDDYTAIYLR